MTPEDSTTKVGTRPTWLNIALGKQPIPPGGIRETPTTSRANILDQSGTSPAIIVKIEEIPFDKGACKKLDIAEPKSDQSTKSD